MPLGRSGLVAALATLALVGGAPPALASDPNAIDTTSRAAVRQAYVDRWLPATTTTVSPAGGSTSTCTPFTTPVAAQDATAGAVSFARGLVGEGAIRLVPSYDALAARAALIMAAQGSLSHDPPGTWSCWTRAGHDAAGRSNLQLSSNVPSAARLAGLYLDDPGSGNTAAGHRRWLLRPEATTMGSGNARGSWFGNALYVFTFADDDAGAPALPYYAWPSAGWFPSPLEPDGRWSLSSSTGASFANAHVTMTGPGGAVPLTQHAVANGYGDNTLVWDLTDPPAAVSGSGDTTYTVDVTGITGGPTSSYSYQVRLFDPSVAVDDPAPTRVATHTANRLSTTTARRDVTRVRVTITSTADDGSVPAGAVALWVAGHRYGIYDLGSDGTRTVRLRVFRATGTRRVHAALRATPTYLRSTSRTRTITVR